MTGDDDILSISSWVLMHAKNMMLRRYEMELAKKGIIDPDASREKQVVPNRTRE